MPKRLAISKTLRIFAPVKTAIQHLRRDGRVVECTGLENRRTARYRGFESLSLRQNQRNSLFYNELR